MENESRTKDGGCLMRPNHPMPGQGLLRGARVGGRIGILWLAFVSMVCASTAMAAEIVEVRVGRHPGFTRVVFELDRAVGYRIERASTSEGGSELVVSLEASSIPRRLEAPKKSGIEQVEIEPSGSRSVARVRLARDGLRLKEMILASPPRIVLDVLSEEPVARTAGSAASSPPTTDGAKTAAKVDSETKSRTASTSRPTTGASQPAEGERVRQTEAATKTQQDTRVLEDRSRAQARVAARADGANDGTNANDGKDANDIDSIADNVADSKGAAEGRVEAGEMADTEGRRAAESEAPSGAMEILRQREAALARAAREPSTSTPTERPAARSASRPTMVDRSAENEDGGGMAWALAAGAGAVLLVGGLLVWRRVGRGRQSAEEVDLEDEDAAQDDAPIELGRSASDADAGNPFAGMLDDDGEQPTLAEPEETTLSPVARREGGTIAFEDAGDGEEKDMEEMEMISRDAVSESLGGMPSAMDGAMGGMSEEIQQIMREMNRRVEALEGRIDELVDARDRLERQVAAQTEELRVQRAAIARTQRAVRNLARPEDEPEATEPALREPNP